MQRKPLKHAQSSIGKKMAAAHLPQYHASLIQPVKYEESHIFAVFAHVLLTLSTLGLKVLERFCTFLGAFFKFP